MLQRLNGLHNSFKDQFVDSYKRVTDKTNKIVVYTAIYGNRDDLKEPSVELEGCSLVCFTDNESLRSKAFDLRVCPPTDSDPVRSAQIFRILPHKFFPDFEYSLWIDGSVVFKKGDIRSLIDQYLRDYDMALFAHPDRDCVYDEAKTWVSIRNEDPKLIRAQMERYRNEGYPPHNGLVAGGIILRRHLSPEVVRVNEDWWNEISHFSRRAQLSFNYVAWRNNFKWATIEGLLWDNEYFRIAEHLDRAKTLRDSLTTLLEIYGRRPDLQKAFPEADTREYANLIRWALGAAEGRWEDSDQSTLQKHRQSYQSLADSGELAYLISLYDIRSDLQAAFPEVKQGNYRNLVNWASGVVNHLISDGYHQILLPYGYWYTLMTVYENRPDLQTAFPNAYTSPASYHNLLCWAKSVVEQKSQDSAYVIFAPYASSYEAKC
jgi:hypothetical protein